MPTAADIIAEARTWLGTPFAHQGNVKGVIADCDNFIAGVAINAHGIPAVDYPNNYRRKEDGSLMREILARHMDSVEKQDARPGDVLALCDEGLREPDKPRHLILLTEVEPYWKGIHATEHGVREHRLDLRFKRRIHSVWRLRNLTDE